jgi:hypothetical protein
MPKQKKPVMKHYLVNIYFHSQEVAVSAFSKTAARKAAIEKTLKKGATLIDKRNTSVDTNWRRY